MCLIDIPGINAEEPRILLPFVWFQSARTYTIPHNSQVKILLGHFTAKPDEWGPRRYEPSHGGARKIEACRARRSPTSSRRARTGEYLT